ncbi:Phosphoglycolate phosphatase, chromosomal [Rhodobacteraceae bacterium THAF1]|uniref:phosphoglycolate phosphatase n=1 Tax=Palleronia sp. THAF1 TaxID=2587842 RepID=UPI000F41772F|nr:phosphoglycolate phosphatase [Palleronia sp. THAF1]QFU08603.1 Phosphoglycolate phosphatase, chromosomal [Palleronia sp. THAF1]VDC30703.1 Phosphoglycolate phosphatase, chromosomal [Rhodobacteraceae bacterium THAF1]
MARIVFDLDGTLIDSAPDIRAAANAALDGTGAEPLSLAETVSFIGHGAPHFVERMRSARGIAETDCPDLLGRFQEEYVRAKSLSRLFPDVTEVLDQLADQGHALGLCTNKPAAPTGAVLMQFGLTDRFKTVVAGDDLPQRKPDPAPLHAVLTALGDGPALYVGDSEVDAETADRAGVPFLLFTKGYRHVAVDQMPHLAAFSDWSDMPGLVAQVLA